MNIESSDSLAHKARYKLVRRDDFTDVPGTIITANEDTGECMVSIATPGGIETKTLSFGPRGIRIVGRRR